MKERLTTYPDIHSADLSREFDLIYDEHWNQHEKWDSQRVTLFEWHNYLTEEVGELAEAIADYEYGRKGGKNIVKEAVQVAALAVKIIMIASCHCKQKKERI